MRKWLSWQNMSVFLSCIYFLIAIPPGKVCALHNTLSVNLYVTFYCHFDGL